MKISKISEIRTIRKKKLSPDPPSSAPRDGNLRFSASCTGGGDSVQSNISVNFCEATGR